MSAQCDRWISYGVGGVLFTLSVLTVSATTGSKGMAMQGAKAGSKSAAPKEKEEVMFPHMDQALAYLRAAQRQLREAEPWFGGHREKAIDHIGPAIEDVQAGIAEYIAKHPSAIRNEINPDTIEVKMGYHLDEALRLTQQAQEELNKASSIFFGKREAALNEVKAAITEMQAGVAYYRAHPHNK